MHSERSHSNSGIVIYVDLVRFVDDRLRATGKSAKLRTLALTLRGEKALDASSSADHRAAIKLDARICAEVVTEILRRLFAEEFA